MTGRDITEGRGDTSAYAIDVATNPGYGRSIAVDLGIVSSTSVWQNTTESFDVAIGGLPFFYAISDARPYLRQTAPFRKEQQDIGTEPGEQSLTGWWLRSQSSFHHGTGIKFYDPSAGETVLNRFNDSQNVDVWTKGQVSLLKETANMTGYTTAAYKVIGAMSGSTNVVIAWTPGGTTIKSLNAAGGTVTTYTHASLTNILDVATDGTNIFIADKTNLFSGIISNGTLIQHYVTGNDNVKLGWVKQRLVGCIGNKVYELTKSASYSSTISNAAATAGTVTITTSVAHGLSVSDPINIIDLPAPFTAYNVSATVTAVGSATTFSFVQGSATVTTASTTGKFIKTSSTALPATAVYTHPNASWVWNSISESGGAIFASGYSGSSSAIYKFILDTTTGLMPTLNGGIIAAQFPRGEIVHKIESYLSYLVIGTSKGIRVATTDTNGVEGSIGYGPIIIPSTQTDDVYPDTGLDFCFRDRYVHVAGSIDGFVGTYRIDLSNQIETLTFPYAKDAFLTTTAGYATSVDFLGNSNQLVFTTSGNNGIAIQSLTVLAASGYITTGKIRFSTLEPKNFKRLIGRGNFTVGNFTLASVATSTAGVETIFDHISYNSGVAAVEVGTSTPAVAQEFLAYKFTLERDTVNTTGPTFRGYQIKATIATPRQRIIKFPVWCYDIETDRFNVVVGYQGRAYDRIQLLEEIEKTGDVLTFQDFTTGETLQTVIEQVTFTRMTPPDRRFDGFGGVLDITVRTV